MSATIINENWLIQYERTKHKKRRKHFNQDDSEINTAGVKKFMLKSTMKSF